jgi:hypothetical protein
MLRSMHPPSLNTRVPLTVLVSYDFDYEDSDEQDSDDVGIENKYYNAKQMKKGDPEGTIEEFLGIPALESTKGEWGFKGLKQAIKLEFQLGRYDKVSSRRLQQRGRILADRQS